MSDTFYRVHLFMKSGNVIVAEDVTKFDYTFTGDRVTEITMKTDLSRKGIHVLIQSVDLSQIEGISAEVMI